MKLYKLKTLLIALCCFVAAACTGTRGMQGDEADGEAKGAKLHEATNKPEQAINLPAYIPENIKDTYKQLSEKDREEINKVYDGSNPEKLSFKRQGKSSGRGAQYNTLLIKCLNCANDSTKEITIITRDIGQATFILFPALPQYTFLETLDVSGNGISDKMAKTYMQSFYCL
jgi:predicted small secreted protein